MRSLKDPPEISGEIDCANRSKCFLLLIYSARSDAHCPVSVVFDEFVL